MASAILSSASYINYLNDYVNIVLESTDRYIIEHIHERYFDEIETSARVILAQWHSEQIIGRQSSSYIENVGYLNRKLGLLSQIYPLNERQLKRIEALLFNSEMIHVLTSIIQSLIETNVRHEDHFLRVLSILIDSYSSIKDSKPIFNQIAQQAIQSKYYKQYLIELPTSNIEVKHLFFIGAIGQLAELNHQSLLNKSYAEFLETFYDQKYFSTNPDVHYCTIGILAQLEISFLINDYTCISTLVSIFLNEKTGIFLLPILTLFNALCIQSKTVACYLNTDQLIDVLLQYVPKQNNSPIHLNACLLLGHLISEKQLKKLRISYKLTMKLMDLLDYYQQERNAILQSLLSLTIHEEIQTIIAQTYQLKDLIQLSKHHPIVYNIIWKLSFHSEILEQLILRHDDFLNELSTISAADGILDNIRTRNLSRLPVINAISCDISLVLSPKDQTVVQQIKDNLLKNNFRIGTVSNSLYILLCVSEDSKHDCSCQAAIRQALLECKKVILCIVQKPYRIDDWFSTLNVQEKNPLNILEIDIENLSSEIEKDLRMSPQSSGISKRTRIITSSQNTFTRSPPLPPPLPSLPPLILPIIPKKKIQTWTNREVVEWCTKNKLSPFAKILTDYNGRSLLALAHFSRMNAPHTIINQLRNDCRKQGLRLSFVEFVRFQTALDDLMRLERNLARNQSISTLANRYVYRGKITTKT